MGLLDKFRMPSAQTVKPSATPGVKVEPPTPSIRAAMPTSGTSSILQKLGRTREASAEGVVPVVGRGVRSSPDLARVLALPKRPRPSESELRGRASALRARLGTGASSCECKSKYNSPCCQDLLLTQALALGEAEAVGGLLGPIGVGHGKTLLDLLIAMVVPGCKVAVLLLPPNLKAQLLERDWHFYGQHWRLPNLAGSRWIVPGRPTLHVVAYTELSSSRSSDLLTRLQPDVIICDEAHSVRNRTASRTKRFLRYLNEHKDVKLFCWSGTLVSRSLKDYAHLSNHALREGSPTPLEYPAVEEWAKALDPGDTRTFAGALLGLCAPGQKLEQAWEQRLNDTPGVVSSPDSGGCKASLVISEFKAEPPLKIKQMLSFLEETAERPDGEQLVDVMSVARAAKELSCGFYYRWRWPRKEPQEVIEKWLMVRKEWHKEMRERLQRSGEFMDSPLLLTKAAIRWHDGYTYIERDEEGKEVCRHTIEPHSKKGPHPTWASEWWPAWREVRDTAQPETEAVWVDDFLVKRAVEWLREGPGLLWYEFKAFGEAVAAAYPEATLCGPGEEGNQKVLHLTGKESCIMSIKAHGTGKNLQAFNRNLIANPPSDGAISEQLLGRTHRTGQVADEVTAEYFRHTEAFRNAIDKARGLSRFISNTFGAKQILADRATWLF